MESDAFFRFISSGYVQPWKQEAHEQNQAVMQIVAQAASGYASAGYFTIIDGIVIPGWFLEPLRDTLHDARQRVAFAVLRSPLSTCRARAQARRREPLGDPDAIEQLWWSFADLGHLEDHAVDVADLDPEEVADLLEQRLQGGLLTI